jgi:hypothetical protein
VPLAKATTRHLILTHIAVTSVVSNGKARRFHLCLKSIFLVISPRQRDNLGIVIPGLFAEDRRKEESQVLKVSILV